MTSLTLFQGIFDNKTHRTMSFDSFEGFEKLLYSLSEQPGYKPKRGDRKRGSVLISPASYKEGTTRANDNVVSWNGWAALDVDEYEGSFDDALVVFSDYYYVCYSTASSTEDHPKFRVVLPFNGVVLADKLRHFWHAMNTEFATMGDKQTKDVSRMYYVPAQYPGAHNFIFTHKGEYLNPFAFMRKHPFVNTQPQTLVHGLPEDMQRKVMQSKLGTLTNREYSWVGWQDCPFINRELVEQYFLISGTGWYRHMYRIMTSIASKAIRRGYPITCYEIAALCREIDNQSGAWYKNRPMEAEADRAIQHVLCAQ